jgi:condensin complex subunit 2
LKTPVKQKHKPFTMVLTAVNNNLARSALDEDDEEILTTKRGGRRIVEDSEEEHDEENAVLSIVMDDSEEEDSDEQEAPRRAAAKPPRPAPSRKMKQQQAPSRRRRRSSARFLRLTGRFEEEEQDEAEEDLGAEQENLGEMYKRAIRMNAENRINAGNSWGLRLIENIDKFLIDEQEQEVEGQRVNFTKASCTLDASVKIYSYRVDDVHLSSYKVLANLNRTETGKKNNRAQEQDETGEGGTTQTSQRVATASSERRGVTDTLESNLGMYTMTL